MLIDTHCHFDADEFAPDRAEVAAQAWAAGVDTIIIPGYVARYWPRLLALCASIQAPRLWPAPGLHPCYINEHTADDLLALEQLLRTQSHCVAVGEIGLDYFLDVLKAESTKQRQALFFREQLMLAQQFGKPVILHVRKAHQDVIRILHEQKFREGGIVHAFSGGVEEARHYVRLGFRLGIGGPLTYEQSKRLRTVVAAMPLEALVLETDAPDMVPLRHRQAGLRHTRNQPGFLPAVAEVLAQLKQLPLPQLMESCRQQSVQVLRLPV